MTEAQVRHLLCALAFAAAALCGLLALDQIGRRSPAPGAIWIVVRGDPGALLARLPRDPGVRILDVWAGGRVLMLHAPALNAVHLPPRAAWIALRGSPTVFSLPACG